jgi:SAM-dependent methyltransferase
MLRSSFAMPADEPANLSGAWEDHAAQWLAWCRTPEHDVYFWRLNLPAFGALLPAAGRRTLDVGCGEGRLGRWLAAAGHRVVGIDSSPTLAAAAGQAGGYEEVVCGDAVALPWPTGHCDLAIAFMSLHDMNAPAAVIHEIARVLEPAGRLCVALVHPSNRSAQAVEDYFNDVRVSDCVSRNGLEMTFESIDRPLESYTNALSDAGFVIEELREPQAAAADVREEPWLAPAAARPFFLHLRCRLDRAGCSREPLKQPSGTLL